MKRAFSALSVLFVLPIVSTVGGCASIVSNAVYPVSIQSDPSQADFQIIDRKGMCLHRGQTPAIVELKAGDGYFRAADYKVKLSKAGYREMTVPIKQKLDAWYVFGNIFVGGLIGWVIVDPITGAMWTLEGVHVTLQPMTATSPAGISAAHVPEALPKGPSPVRYQESTPAGRSARGRDIWSARES